MLESRPEPVKMRSVIFNPAKPATPRLPLLVLFFLVAGTLGATPTGPTLRLDYGRGPAAANPISQFMYFVPLISPEPVSIFTNAGNTQCARVRAFQCRTNGAVFIAACEFEFTGEGFLRNDLDHTQLISQHRQQLQAGGTLAHKLGSINVEGAGSGRVEITGTLTNGTLVVNEVRLRFDSHGHASPVSIVLQDISWRNKAIRLENETVARVSSLTFRRQPGPPKMEITLVSIKRREAGSGIWQNFVGSLKGKVANLFIPPITVTADGHQAMLDFGLALATEQPAFTFAFAHRLKESAATTP